MIFSLLSKSQSKESNDASFADTVKKYFDYNKLNQIPCSETPPGIYALSFRIDKSNKPFDFQWSADSLETLKGFFIDAIKVSADKVGFEKSKKRYLQLCYFNILLWCNSSNDTTKLSNNIYSDLSKLLSNQLTSIEKTFKKSIKDKNDYRVLETVVINDNNPNQLKLSTRFQNDTGQRSVTKEEIEKMELMIQEIKRKKEKN